MRDMFSSGLGCLLAFSAAAVRAQDAKTEDTPTPCIR